jgi:glycosyltransferase involved in cell wall biosynthesis
MLKGKKTVLFVNSNFPYGGASANLLRYFSIGLANQHCEIEVIISGGNYYGNKIEGENLKKGMIEGVPYKHLCFLNHPRNYFGKVLDNICSFCSPILYLIKLTFKRKVDLIIVYNTTFLSSLNYVILKHILQKKLVIILPEFYEKPKCNFFSLHLFKWYSFFFGIRYIVKYADGFIVLSTYLRDFLKNQLKSLKPIYIMPNLIDPDMFDSGWVNPFREGKITIGYAGTPVRKDGILDLMASFSILHNKFPDTHLLIIGDLTNGSTVVPQLKKYAEELDVSDEITFTGLVSYKNIPLLLNSCQILTLTRPNGIFAEAGFPTKLGEYFCCKKPVVITIVGDIPKYFINEEHAILVEPENIESIVSGFEKILYNKELSEKISINAYHWMDANLNYKNASQNITRFLSEF